MKPIELSLLVALCGPPAHGYSLVRRVEEESDGRVKLLPGNLYAILQRLTAAGWIQEVDAPAESDQRRRYYQITELGTAELARETAALGRHLALAQERLLAR